MARSLSCIIVDDDPFSTKIMSGYVSRLGYVELSQVFTNAVDAVDFLSSFEGRHIDMVFLDIEMPDMNGIEFLQTVDLSGKEVVIYSSQEKYALESYEYDVCDYLLKPVTYARFIKAVSKARIALEHKGKVPSTESEANDSEDKNIVFLKDNTGDVHKVRCDEIVFIEAMENYVSVRTVKQTLTVHSPMKKLAETLPDDLVKRIHRSFGVGLRFISKVTKDSITVECGTFSRSFPVSRTYLSEVKKLLDTTANNDWEE